ILISPELRRVPIHSPSAAATTSSTDCSTHLLMMSSQMGTTEVQSTFSYLLSEVSSEVTNDLKTYDISSAVKTFIPSNYISSLETETSDTTIMGVTPAYSSYFSLVSSDITTSAEFGPTDVTSFELHSSRLTSSDISSLIITSGETSIIDTPRLEKTSSGLIVLSASTPMLTDVIVSDSQAHLTHSLESSSPIHMPLFTSATDPYTPSPTQSTDHHEMSASTDAASRVSTTHSASSTPTDPPQIYISKSPPPPESNARKPHFCPCSPNFVANTQFSAKQMSLMRDAIKRSLTVNKSQISAYTREKTSTWDNRPHATIIGTAGLVALGGLLTILLLPDFVAVASWAFMLTKKLIVIVK
ncbi:hypothetical protein Bpfe_013079, partial [Biomphalaria pfeifferi]